MTTRETARQNLGIHANNRIIISLDGGGMKGIFTLQLLKKLEAVAGGPIYQWADMVAGTSTGAIIAGLIASKKTATEIEGLYKQLVSRVFTKRGFLANRFVNPPAFDKKYYRKLLKDIVQNQTLKDANATSGLDMLLTSKDMKAGEETFFTCFNNSGTIKGTYQDVLLRSVMEATMSAPTYFLPFERFVDGGTTSFNNPVLSAVMEAITYDGKGKYKQDELTVFSFGTANRLRFIDVDDIVNPKGADIMFWLSYVMEEASKDASEMQIDLLRSGLLNGVDIRRYQLSLDTEAIHKLPDRSIEEIPEVEANTLHGLEDDDLAHIDMSDVSKFPLMTAIGEAVAEFICPPAELNIPANQRQANWFQKDLIDPNTKRGTLVTAHGEINTIKANLSNAGWVDGRPTG